MLRCAPWRSTHRVRSILTLCTAGAAVLKSTPVLASDPAGTFSGLYMFLLLVPWLALNLVLTVVIAIKGGYRSVASAKLHAAVGATVPLLGLGVTAFDYLVEGAELETQVRVRVTAGFVSNICETCRGLPATPYPATAIVGRTSNVRRYYWREIAFETMKRFDAWLLANKVLI